MSKFSFYFFDIHEFYIVLLRLEGQKQELIRKIVKNKRDVMDRSINGTKSNFLEILFIAK